MQPKMSINKMLVVPHVISVQDWNPRGPGLGKHWDRGGTHARHATTPRHRRSRGKKKT